MAPKQLQRTAPTAADLVPALPANLDSATDMMRDAIVDFQRATLRQAVLVSHARSDLFHGEAGPWLSWCMDTCGLKKRYTITLWHAGDLLRKCGNPKLLGCSADKLEMVGTLDDNKLAMFLEHNDPAEMTRDEVRDKVATYLDRHEALDDDGDDEESPRKSRKDASPVAKHFRAIDLMSQVSDEDRLLISTGASPTACIQAGLACLDIAMHLLGVEHCWDREQLERWAPEIRSTVDVYNRLIEESH